MFTHVLFASQLQEERQAEIDHQNNLLLTRMTEILQKPGRVDNWNEYRTRRFAKVDYVLAWKAEKMVRLLQFSQYLNVSLFISGEWVLFLDKFDFYISCPHRHDEILPKYKYLFALTSRFSFDQFKSTNLDEKVDENALVFFPEQKK